MLSLLPNECTGDHRDKPLRAKVAILLSACTVHFMRLKLFVPKGLLSSLPPLVVLSLLLVPLRVLYSPAPAA